MSLRKHLYYAAKAAVKSTSPRLFESRLREYRAGIAPGTVDRGLSAVLRHSLEHVPYYRKFSSASSLNQIETNPREVLSTLPILTRSRLQQNCDDLLSDDAGEREGIRTNATGGSTGEPVRMVQDEAYRSGVMANTLLFSALAGKLPGDYEVRLWGSERDIFASGMGFKANLQNKLANVRFMNAFRMTRGSMCNYLAELNERPPKLIVGYAEALYSLASFAHDEDIKIRPAGAAITSAGTLYPFMRQRIADAFGCNVYNRYGCREAGDIACDLPAGSGDKVDGRLWVSPWSSFVEVVDEAGRPVADGEEGDILVTSLCNYAMPLLRYRIGDRGVLGPEFGSGPEGQTLNAVTGRITDNFVTREGRIIPGAYFVHLVGVVLNAGDIRRFQVIQRDFDSLELLIVSADKPFQTDDIVAKMKLVMSEKCRVDVKFVAEIPESGSGKFRYTLCEVGQ